MPPPNLLYCAEQIKIPAELPDILKNFTKAAIRTQPADLLTWSAAYFTALSKGECLPVKERVELSKTKGTCLTPGLLKTLHKQMCHNPKCTRDELKVKWKGLCLPVDQMEALLALGGFDKEIEWILFFALGCSALGGTLSEALRHACEILTEDEEGGAARIPFDVFTKIYTFLALKDDEVLKDQIPKFLNSMKPQVELQHGMIRPVDFINFKTMKTKINKGTNTGTPKVE